MSDTPIPFAKRLQWRFECLMHTLVELLACMLPGSWVFHAGESLAGLVWHFLPRRRRIVLRNLRIAYAGEKPIEEIRRMAKASFRRSGGNLISGAHTARLSPSRLGEVLKIDNLELLQQSMDRGKGVVLLLSHMGNWELLSRLIHFFPKGAKAGAMYRPLNNLLMDERVCARRQADGTRMFSKRDPFHQITGFLRDGGIVGVLVDQRVGANGDHVRFFGRLTKASPLPSLLARRAKADVLALSMVTERPGKWRAKFQAVESPPSTTNCMKALEAAMRQGPEDVFWLQDRWRVRLGPAHLLSEALDGGLSDPGKGHRALLWLVGQEASGLSEQWLQPDVVYEVAIDPQRPLPPWLPESTRIHRVAPAAGIDRISTVLRDIDSLEAIPLDYVLTFKLGKDLRRACKRECIPAYSEGLGASRPRKKANRA